MFKAKNKSAVLLIISIHLLLFSCVSPQPIIQLQPVAESTRFYLGAEYIECSYKDIKASVSFSSYRESIMIFDVEIINNSKKSMLVDPVTFFYFPLEADPRGLDAKETNKLSGSIPAIDPEQMILSVNNSISQENADYSNDSAVSAVGGLFSIIGGFAASNDKEREEADEMSEEAEDDSRDREIEHHQRINSLNYRRDFWERYSIRKTTLDPGKAIKGKVSFYSYISAKYIELYIPAEENVFKFLFSQQVIRPAR